MPPCSTVEDPETQREWETILRLKGRADAATRSVDSVFPFPVPHFLESLKADGTDDSLSLSLENQNRFNFWAQLLCLAMRNHYLHSTGEQFCSRNSALVRTHGKSAWFNVFAGASWMGSNWLASWLTELCLWTLTEQNDVPMSEMLWYNLEKEIKNHRCRQMLEYNYHTKTAYLNLLFERTQKRCPSPSLG